MKKIKSMIFVFCMITFANNSFAQKFVTGYFLLDSMKQKDLKFNHIKCADNLYKTEIFNVFYGKDTARSNATENISLLTLFTALPDYKTRKPEWKEITLDTIVDKLISRDSLLNQFDGAYRRYIKTKGGFREAAELKSISLKPIIKIGNKYFSPSSPVLMEHFAVVKILAPMGFITNVFPNLNQFCEINTDAPIFSLKTFENMFVKQFAHMSFNSRQEYERYNSHNFYNIPLLIRNDDTKIAGKKAYKFWTLASWTIHGGSERGIDRFAYIPEYGIVSGSWSYYFWDESDSGRARFLNNYLNDIQLMPYEINGKKVK